MLRAGITLEEATEHLKILLAILRFKTHTDYYLRSEYERRPRVRPRRHNLGSSLVHEDIVSTADYPIEEASLFCIQYTRKDYRTSHQVGKGYVQGDSTTFRSSAALGTEAGVSFTKRNPVRLHHQFPASTQALGD